MYTTGGYSYGGPADGSNIQVGFGVSVAQNMSGVRELSADFHVYPRMNKNQKRDNKATASFKIPALFTYSAFPLVADIHGGIPVSDSGAGSNVNPGQSASVIPVTESPVITVTVSYDGGINNAHFSAINDDLQYLSGGETFYANDISSTQIDVAGGKFDAYASLNATSIEFVATAENDGRTLYTAVVSAEFTYEAIQTPFYPTETHNAAKMKKFAKRDTSGGGGRPLRATASTTLSTQISHSTLTSTSTSPITTTSHTTPTSTSTPTPTPTTSTSSDSDNEDNSGSLSYNPTYNKDGSIDVAIFADAAIKKHGSLSYSASDASNFKFSSASSGSTDGDFTISGVEIDKNSGASFQVSVSSGSGKKLVKRASWDLTVSLNAVGGTSSSSTTTSSSSITTTSAKSTSSSNGNGNGNDIGKTTVSSSDNGKSTVSSSGNGNGKTTVSSSGNGNGKTTVSSSDNGNDIGKTTVSSISSAGPGAAGSVPKKDGTSSSSADDSSSSGPSGSNGSGPGSSGSGETDITSTGSNDAVTTSNTHGLGSNSPDETVVTSTGSNGASR
ncbi:unnamed protein product [Ambrosiozyma monospora]|uniref:Unnamed protein product n=1 Tax=Ambrosiozyma monospora TaxID=43982 RepID=A0A9W6Z671_AMBMO|nr:unnamed protein product [Ambrosiozyma monospora]